MNHSTAHDPSSGLVHAAISSRVGTYYDPPQKEGATRLLLRMMRRVTKGRTASEVDREIDRLGAAIGVEAARSSASFYASALARNQRPTLDLLAEMMGQSPTCEQEFERLRGEALSDWRESLNDDSVLVRRAFVRTLLKDHPHGRLSAGTHDSLSRITLADLQALRAIIFPQNELVSWCAGAVDEPFVSDYFGRSSGFCTPNRQSLTIPDPRPPSGTHLVFVDKPERTQTQIILGCLGTSPKDDDHTALLVANTIFGGTFSSRLSQQVRVKRGWSYGATSQLPLDRTRQAFSMWTFPAERDAVACISLKIDLLHQWIERGVSKRELAQAKRYLTNSHPFLFDTAAKRASLLADEMIYGLAPGYFSRQLERIAAVTQKDIAEALPRRLSAENLVIAVVGTSKTLLDPLKKSLGPNVQTTVIPYQATS